jgi:hypothetical protein
MEASWLSLSCCIPVHELNLEGVGNVETIRRVFAGVRRVTLHLCLEFTIET